MNKNDIITLNINSDAFYEMKEDFNEVLRRTLMNMNSKASDEASLTLKMNISFADVNITEYDKSGKAICAKKVKKPRFDHKISSVMQIKTEASGTLEGEYELEWSENEQDFVMKPIDDGQESLYDYVMTETVSSNPEVVVLNKYTECSCEVEGDTITIAPIATESDFVCDERAVPELPKDFDIFDE